MKQRRKCKDNAAAMRWLRTNVSIAFDNIDGQSFQKAG